MLEVFCESECLCEKRGEGADGLEQTTKPVAITRASAPLSTSESSLTESLTTSVLENVFKGSREGDFGDRENRMQEMMSRMRGAGGESSVGRFLHVGKVDSLT